MKEEKEQKQNALVFDESIIIGVIMDKLASMIGKLSTQDK